MKTCITCKTEKPKTEFSKCAQNKCGLRANCKCCEREYRQANSEKISARMREYRQANAEKIAETHRKYREENSEKIADQVRKYVKDNLEKVMAYRRGYAKDNPEKITAYSRNRRAKVRNADGRHSAADVRAIFEAQRGLCSNCQAKLFKSGAKKYHIDHIMPLKLGGSNWPSNLQCLCPSCNMSKNAKDPIMWAQENGRLL